MSRTVRKYHRRRVEIHEVFHPNFSWREVDRILSEEHHGHYDRGPNRIWCHSSGLTVSVDSYYSGDIVLECEWEESTMYEWVVVKNMDILCDVIERASRV